MLDKIVLKGKEMQLLTDEEFFAFCQSNPELNIERNKQREIIIMSPTGSLSSYRNSEIVAQLSNWNDKYRTGLVFDSSGGFTLPDQSIKAPDAAWVSKNQWKGLSQKEKEGFAPVCPEFIVELKSKSDRLKDVQRKMEEWLANGVLLGWLIDPEKEETYIYSSKQPTTTITGFDQKVSADPVLPGFQLDLSRLRI